MQKPLLIINRLGHFVDVMRCLILTMAVSLALLLLLPPLALFCGSYYSYRKLKTWLWLSSSDQIMLPQDALWYKENLKNNIYVHSVVFLQRSITLQQLISVWEERIATNARFVKFSQRERLVSGLLVWSTEWPYKLESHFRIHPVECENESDLQREISAIVSLPTQHQGSPWNATIINRSDGGSVILFKVKHTIADGIALTRLFMEHMLDEPVPITERFSNRASMASKTLWDWILEFPKLVLVYPRIFLPLFRKKDFSLLHGRNLSGSKVVAWSRPVPLKLVHSIKSALAVTINDVLTTAVCGALSDFLSERRCLEQSALTLFMPASLATCNKPFQLKNDIGIFHCQLPVLRMPPLQRLLSVKGIMSDIKSSRAAELTALTQKLCATFLPITLMNWAADEFSRCGTALMSNIPGPTESVKLCDSIIQKIFFLAPTRADMGISISAFSYNGEIHMAVTADTALIANPNVVCDLLVTNIDHLAESAKLNHKWNPS